MVYDSLGILSQEQLLGNLLFHRCKTLLVSIANRGEDYHIGLYHLLETLHFALLRDTCLDKSDLIGVLQHQKRQRHTQLRVVTAWRAEKFHIAWCTLRNPLFDGGLAIRAGDSHNLAIELLAIVCCQRLQCCE